MVVREYTRVKKNNVIIFRKKGVVSLNNVIKNLKKRGVNDRFQIEYVLTQNRIAHPYAIHLFNQECIKVGMIFPYGCYENNKTQS